MIASLFCFLRLCACRSSSLLPRLILLLAPLCDACTLKEARARSQDQRARESLFSSFFFFPSLRAVSRLHLINIPMNGADRDARIILRN